MYSLMFTYDQQALNYNAFQMTPPTVSDQRLIAIFYFLNCRSFSLHLDGLHLNQQVCFFTEYWFPVNKIL